MKKGILTFIVLALVFAVAAPVLAEDAAQETKAATRPVLKNELVRLKYADAPRIQALLYPYLSRDGHISMMPSENVIVISDVPENVEKALQVVKQLDVKPTDLQFTVQLILGSAEAEKGAEPMPNDPIVKELRNLLMYKSYSLLDTSLIRAMDDSNSEVRLGDHADFEFQIRPKVIKDEKSSIIQMEVRLRQVRIAGMPPNATSAKVEYITTDLIETTLNVKPGDKTVVGVSKLDGGDKGLILIISGKIIE
jgi:hypothetical protein